ncbi:MAG: OmpA family protein [Pirellulales bacterium]|nr:OmpA family protein [Pirellulales bacterium]
MNIAGRQPARSRFAGCLCALAALAASGCTQNPMMMQSQIQSLQQQQLAISQQNRELQTRATTLDNDNQELERLLAQSQQQVRLFEDQVTVMREQLTATSSQLAQARDLSEEFNDKHKALQASIRSRGSAQITANNSFKAQLPDIVVAGLNVRRDGDVVRIELPGTRLFVPGGARLLPEASPLLDQVSAELKRIYAGQVIGVEGFTDSDPVQTSQWQNNHQLSVGQAMAVYDYMTVRGGFRADQLFVVGHGSNHPVVSNATPAGKERNRRVELVVYPEQVGRN